MWPEKYKAKLYLRKLGYVWQVYLDGKSVHHGTKKECERFIEELMATL